MNLWIVDQSETVQLEVNFVKIEKKVDTNTTGLYSGYYRIITLYNGTQYILGRYETEKRAREVFNEITNILSPKYLLRFVYKMPEK